jgi:acyl carrier protein
MEVQTGSEKEINQQFEVKLLQIVRRYNDDAEVFDMSASVFDHSTGMDSLDLAEIFSWIEQTFGVSPMEDQGLKYETWDDLAQWVFDHLEGRSPSH